MGLVLALLATSACATSVSNASEAQLIGELMSRRNWISRCDNERRDASGELVHCEYRSLVKLTEEQSAVMDSVLKNTSPGQAPRNPWRITYPVVERVVPHDSVPDPHSVDVHDL